MNVRSSLGQAGLRFLGLLALVVVLGASAFAQSSRIPAPVDQALRDAALNGRIEAVRSGLGKGASPDARGPDGRTALMMAAFNGHAETVELLLDRGASTNVLDGAGRTALVYAAAGPYAETVRLLLARGADPDVADGEEGFTALMFAAAEGQTEVLEVLLAHGADRKIVDQDGDTALDFAVKNRHDEVVKALQNAGLVRHK